MSLRPIRFGHVVLLSVLAATLGLTGCGRKGPLDPPPSAAAVPAQEPEAASSGVNPMARSAPKTPEAFGPDGQPIAPKGVRKPLPLDWLLD